MTQADLIALHGLITRDDEESYKRAVEFIAASQGKPQDIPKELALAYLTAFLHSLLASDKYIEAATFLWGARTFDPRPRSVRKIWKLIDEHDKLLCLGGGAQSKTYTPTVKFFLRWVEDPQHTSIKLVSTTGGHARSNIFAGFVKLHRESCIPLPGFVRENYIGIDINEMYASIQKVSIAKGEDGTAALRGFHRLPRKTPHPKFGDMSVIIVVVDEADNVPWGFWKGADNIASGRGGKGTIKIYGATNPMLLESEFAARAQPAQGWSWIDKENMHEWQGRQGWYVLRLDVRQSENYKQRKEVCKGQMTWEAAKEYEEKGRDHPDYWTFILGLYPMASAKYYVVPRFILDDIRGTYNFLPPSPHNVASFDPAFEEGGDVPVLTQGRYGLVNGFRAFEGENKNKLVTFAPKWALQIEQQIPLIKTANPLDMADDLIFKLKNLQVRPEWFVFDMTGNATLLYGYLLRKYGAVMGLKWGSKATEKKVFEEDTEPAEEQFVGLISEMWFSFSRWAQFGYTKIAPMMQTGELFNEMGSRKYEQASKTMMLVETKADFKSNNSGKSPDYSDSAIMLVHLCRIRGQERAAMLPPQEKPKPPDIWGFMGEIDRPKEELHSVVDTIPFMKFDD